MPDRMPGTSTILRFLFASVLIARAWCASAEHLPGGSITYTCQGGNQYVVRLTLYRECTGENMIPQTLNFRNDCGVQFTLNNIEPVAVEEVSQLCPEAASSSTCQGGTSIGVQRYTYERTLFLSPCNSWTISWAVCCRAPSLNVQFTPGLYIEARLNNADGGCYNSPVPTQLTIPTVCVDQPVAHAGGAIDLEGDSLHYSLIAARYSAPAPTPVNYLVPNFGGEPFPGMAIDSRSGIITFTPTTIGRVIVVVKVDEYRTDGTYIGSVMHDFLFLVAACANNTPDPESGTVQDSEGGAQPTGTRSVDACAGTSFCATLRFTDADADQQLSLTSTVATVLPGATLLLSGTNELLATLCWDVPTDAAGSRIVTFTVQDDACPIPAQQTYALQIDLRAVPDPGTDTSIAYCPGTEAFVLLDSLGGTPAPGGSWTDPFSQPTDGTFVPGSSPNGEYQYTHALFPGCSRSATLTVEALPSADPACSPLSMEAPNDAPLVVRQDGPVLVLSGLPEDAYELALYSTDGRLLHVYPTRGSEVRTAPLTAPSAVLLLQVRTTAGIRSTHRVALLP
ncbi:MAG: hypothetical protein R2817_11750 [Flavobacteriales bacterium]